MKITELNLIAFGPFTDTTLDFSRGRQGLHIVYGPNEAGKSSSLRALTDWLFGLPATFRDDFRHAKSSVRLGGRLLDSEGRELAFVRRRGRQKTLRCENDKAVIDDECLEAFLGTVDRDVFRTMFGIDHHRLRSGGEELAAGKGKLGETLFAAGAGLFELQSVQESLGQQTSQLLTDSRRSGAIQKTLKAYHDLKAEVKAAQLTVETWQSHSEALGNAQNQKKKLDERIGKLDAQRIRLERFQNAVSPVGRWRLKTSRLAELSDVPTMPENFADQIQTLFQDLRSARSLQAEHKSDLAKIEKELGQVSLNEPLLGQTTAIEDLQQRSGQFRTSLLSRSELAIKKDMADDRVRLILKELGREDKPGAVDDLRLPRDRKNRIQELGNRHATLLERVQADRKSFERLGREVQQAKKNLADAPSVDNLSDFRRLLKDAQSQGDLDERLRTAQAELEKLRIDAELAVQNLPFFEGSLAELESMPVPLLATIDEFLVRLKDSDDAVQLHSRRLDEADQRLTERESALRKLESGRPVPTQSKLDRARELREQGWLLLMLQWEQKSIDKQKVAEYVSHFVSARGLTDAYRQSVTECDRLADLLRIDAERVATKSALESEIDAAKSDLKQHSDELKAAESNVSAVTEQWHEIWSSTGVQPASPSAMRDWLRKRESIVELSDAIRQKSSDVDRLSQQRNQWIGKLRNALVLAVGDETATWESDSLSDIVSRAVVAAEELQAAVNLRSNLESKLEELSANADEADAAVKQSQDQLDEMRAAWASETTKVGLQQDALPGEVNQRLTMIDELVEASSAATLARQDIDACDRFTSDFESDLQAVLKKAANHLLDQSSKEAFSQLLDELRVATALRDRQTMLKQRQAELSEKLESTARQAKQHQGHLQNLVSDARAKSIDDLPAAAERSELKRTLQTELREVEDELAPYCKGCSLDDFATEAEQENSDESPIEPRIEQLKTELVELNQQRDAVIAEIKAAEIALSQFDGNDIAARKYEQCESLAAKLEDQLREYSVLKVASVALKTAIERHREKNQGPVLSRASEIFREITLGRFTALQADFDDKGEPVLVGIRGSARQSDGDSTGNDGQNGSGQRGLFDSEDTESRVAGERVPVSGMSDGTCDQLYLALRLASLENWLDGPNEPMPFIVDDVLMNFDDDRSVATLKVLAKLSRRTQVIFFTHHQHMVQLAKTAVPKKDLFVSTLAS